MASVLSSLGITGTTPPPASNFADQQAETANLSTAKAQLSGVSSNIGLVLSGAKLANLDPSYTKSLQNLSDEATSLSNSNMNSAQLSAQSTALQGKLTAAQGTQAAATKEQLIRDLTAAANTISTRLAIIKGDKTVPPATLQKYVALNTSAQAAIAAAKSAPLPNFEGFVDVSGAVIVQPTPDELLSQLEELDTALEAIQNKEFNWPRFFKKIVKVGMYYNTIIACIFGALLGGIITSNIYASDYFWGIKLYYFIYGAAFFPLTILYGTIKTPYWVSGLIPIFSVDTLPPPTPLAPAAAAPVAAPAPKSATAKLAAALPSIPKVTLPKLFGGGESDAQSGPMPVAPAPAAPAVPITTRLFGYKLVDPATPTAADTTNKTILRIMAGVDLTMLTASAIYYGLDKLIPNSV
jgi:hypothetical protein